MPYPVAAVRGKNFGKSILPYTLNFTGLSAFPAGWAAPNWAVSSNTAKNTPAQGSELLTNGNMETGNPPGDWVAARSGTLTGQADERTGGVGVQCLQIENGAAANGAARQGLGGAIGNWILFSGWGKTVSTGVTLQHISSAGAVLKAITLNSGGNWLNGAMVSRRVAAGEFAELINNNATLGRQSKSDDISTKILSDLLAYRNFNAANIRVKATWTITTGYQAGVVARVSSDGSQYLLAYHDRTTCYLLKVLMGGTTQLIGITTAYVAGANVEIRCNGNTVQLFYNNAQVGTDQTESTLNANTRHGLFSTDVSNTCSSFSVVKN